MVACLCMGGKKSREYLKPDFAHFGRLVQNPHCATGGSEPGPSSQAEGFNEAVRSKARSLNLAEPVPGLLDLRKTVTTQNVPARK